MKLKAKARKLLLKVKAHILEEPLRLRMGEFIRVSTMSKTDFFGQAAIGYGKEGSSDAIRYPQCNTVGCVAGWLDLLANGMPEGERSIDARRAGCLESANKLLGFDDDVTRSLFYVHTWKEPFKSRYMKAERPATRAKITAEVIDDFIATH